MILTVWSLYDNAPGILPLGFCFIQPLHRNRNDASTTIDRFPFVSSTSSRGTDASPDVSYLTLTMSIEYQRAISSGSGLFRMFMGSEVSDNHRYSLVGMVKRVENILPIVVPLLGQTFSLDPGMTFMLLFLYIMPFNQRFLQGQG